MEIKTSFEVNMTLVANDFIDRYMAAANGEYVKVYLYILRHQKESLDITGIADALNHTESDVRRALTYWEKLGALSVGEASAVPGGPSVSEASARPGVSGVPEASAVPEASGVPETSAGSGMPGMPAASGSSVDIRAESGEDVVGRLSGDEEFAQLLYIAQKYMNKIFTQRECQVFAYLYDGLHMNTELLEYLVEYCVQGGHTSIRYIETVAMSWHKKGFATVEEARAYTSTFTKNSFAVMRAFGLADRGPGAAEKEMIERWFLDYGFSKELVLEACSRTLEATHSPSFRYADKILSEWKKAGVRRLGDVAALDEKHQSRTGRSASRKPANQFHNFEQRNTDYDSMVLDQVKSWIKES